MFPGWSYEFTKMEAKLECKFWRFFPVYILGNLEPRVRLDRLNQESFTIVGKSEHDIFKKAAYKISETERKQAAQDAELESIHKLRQQEIAQKKPQQSP